MGMEKFIEVELTPSWKKAIAFSKRIRAKYESDFGMEECGGVKIVNGEGKEFEGNKDEAFCKEQT